MAKRHEILVILVYNSTFNSVQFLPSCLNVCVYAPLVGTAGANSLELFEVTPGYPDIFQICKTFKLGSKSKKMAKHAADFLYSIIVQYISVFSFFFLSSSL